MEISDNVTGQKAVVPDGMTIPEATAWAEETFATRGWNKETHEHLGYLFSTGDPSINAFARILGWDLSE